METYLCRCCSPFKRIASMRMRWFCCCCCFGWCSCSCSCPQRIGYVICGQWLRYRLQRRPHCCWHYFKIAEIMQSRTCTDAGFFCCCCLWKSNYALWTLTHARIWWILFIQIHMKKIVLARFKLFRSNFPQMRNKKMRVNGKFFGFN